ncbi:hypothetical protein Y032_0365g3579 [Ancylostoma ceylanicum]|uniref:Uncharacterized protein n=1 Tax=Ancylostoma ceylanicum TaxID=53326 RepID=A0A016RUV4_9BILA|nr:hypothetical protein Y032_0365g3579 [Ancylostoma ceylanicum]
MRCGISAGRCSCRAVFPNRFLCVFVFISKCLGENISKTSVLVTLDNYRTQLICRVAYVMRRGRADEWFSVEQGLLTAIRCEAGKAYLGSSYSFEFDALNDVGGHPLAVIWLR